jgi:hypothetical protein
VSYAAIDPVGIKHDRIKHQGLKLGEVLQEVSIEPVKLPHGEVSQHSEVCQILFCQGDVLWQVATVMVDAQVGQHSQRPGLAICAASGSAGSFKAHCACDITVPVDTLYPRRLSCTYPGI